MNSTHKMNGGSGWPATLTMPRVIFGTSSLGNLFTALDEEVKFGIVQACVRQSKGPVIFDSAGKYGAGLSLEVLGKCLNRLQVRPEDVVISNKLGWLRTELKTAEPTFEPGVWKDLQHDAIQQISYDGIMACFEQGNELLGGYTPQMVSVHDPDEYLAAAANEQAAQRHYQDILDAYDALFELKRQGKVKAIGVGAKDWRVIKRIAGDVALDWVMIANSMTLKTHPPALLDFIQELEQKGIAVINSAVFHSGFLVGSNHFDYRPVEPGTPGNDALFEWRSRFFQVCQQYGVQPAAACIQFALRVPGVKSIALNTTHQKRVKENLDMAERELPPAFWESLTAAGLMQEELCSRLRLVS